MFTEKLSPETILLHRLIYQDDTVLLTSLMTVSRRDKRFEWLGSGPFCESGEYGRASRRAGHLSIRFIQGDDRLFVKPHMTKVTCFLVPQRTRCASMVPLEADRTTLPTYGQDSTATGLRRQRGIQTNQVGQGAGASPANRRNFRLQLQPSRCRDGFE